MGNFWLTRPTNQPTNQQNARVASQPQVLFVGGSGEAVNPAPNMTRTMDGHPEPIHAGPLPGRQSVCRPSYHGLSARGPKEGEGLTLLEEGSYAWRSFGSNLCPSPLVGSLRRLC